jgi:hypothetical protein
MTSRVSSVHIAERRDFRSLHERLLRRAESWDVGSATHPAFVQAGYTSGG